MEQHCQIQRTHNEEREELLLIYPGQGGTPLRQADFARLEGTRFLGDPVVNIIASWAQQTMLDERGHGLVQLVSSFTYEALTRRTNRKTVAADDTTLLQNFRRVGRYRNNRGPGAKPVTVIPVCEDSHWFVVFLVRDLEHNTAVAALADSWATSSRMHACRVFRRYLEATAAGCKVGYTRLRVMQQTNLYDCGIHCIHNMARAMQWFGHQGPILEGLADFLNTSPCPITRCEIQQTLGKLIAGEAKSVDPPAPEPMLAPQFNPISGPPKPSITPLSGLDSGSERELDEHSMFMVAAHHHWAFTDTSLLENFTNSDWLLPTEQVEEVERRGREAQGRLLGSERRRLKFKQTLMGDILSFRVSRGSVRVVRIGEVPLDD